MEGAKLLSGKVCLVTGAGKGIGRAIAERYAQEGAIVYANARSEGSIDEWAAECAEKFGTEVLPLYFDVTDANAAKNAIMQIKKEHQKLDVLVNNAGVVTYELLSMINFDSLREMLDVNVIATIQLTQLASRLMSRQKSGSIINMSSIVGVKGVQGQLAYAATKGAVNAITLSAAKELAPLNIRVNAVAPGMVGTERLLEVFEKSFKERLSDIGMGRLAKPEEVADTFVYLASDLSSYVSGQIIGVDGSTVL